MDQTKRIKELAAKIYYIENEYVRSQLSKWAEAAEPWAQNMYDQQRSSMQKTKKAFALSYMLNHLCPNLEHRMPKPDKSLLSMGQYGLEKYERMQHEYIKENSQVAFAATKYATAQEGINGTDEEYDILMGKAAPFIGVQCFAVQDGPVCMGRLPYATAYAKSEDEARQMLGVDESVPLYSIKEWAELNENTRWPGIQYKPNRCTYRNPETSDLSVLHAQN